MPTQRKIDSVEEVKKRISRATITIGADFRGLRVQEMDQLRRRMRESKVEVRVVKNSLLRLAAEQSGIPELTAIVEGPTALVLGYEDPIEAAKAVGEFAKSAPPTFAIRGAFMEGQVISSEDLMDIVNLPPKPVMLAQLAGQLQAPLAAFSGLLEAPLRELASLLQSALSELPSLIEARARQLETTQGQP